MRSLVWSLAMLVLLAVSEGCSDERPAVEAVSPLSGAWGTTVQLRSSRMHELRSIAIGDDYVEPNRIEVRGPVATFAVRYPTRGRIVVTLGEDEYDVGSFEPSWETSEPISASRLLASRANAEGGLDAVVEGPGGIVRARFFAAGDESNVTLSAPSSADAIQSARLLEHGVIATTKSGALIEIDDGGAITRASPSFEAGAEVVAVREAPDGLHAWIRRACELVLVVRSDEWRIVRGPIALAKVPCDGAFAEAQDGTLHAVLVGPTGSFFDQKGSAFAMKLEPTATAATTTLLDRRDDAIEHEQVLLAEGEDPIFVYCNDDTLPDEGVPSVCRTRSRADAPFRDLPAELPLGSHYARAKRRVVAAKPHLDRYVLAEGLDQAAWPTIMSGNVTIEDLSLDERGAPLVLVRPLGQSAIAAVRPRR